MSGTYTWSEFHHWEMWKLYNAHACTYTWSEFCHWEMWNLYNAHALWFVRFLRHIILSRHTVWEAFFRKCSASSPFGNRGCSADLQNSLALVHHLGTTAVLQTLETLCLSLFWGPLLCYRHRTVFCKCPIWKSLLYWRLHKQLSASASFGNHALEILEVKKCSHC